MSEAGQAGPRDPAFDAIALLVTRGLSAPLDQADSAELDRLIAATPGGEAFAQELIDQWTLAGIAGKPRSRVTVPSAEPFGEVEQTPSDAPRHGWWRRGAIAAALALVALTGGTLAWRQFGSGEAKPLLIAATSEPITTTLQDGSSVSLSRDGKVEVQLKPHQRLLRQIGGEAYYEVAKDHTRPFTVEASGYRVTALGTRFNVAPGPAGLVVDLLSGRVRIETARGGDAPVFLTAGQRFIGGAHPHVAPADPSAADWRTGRLVFNDLPLAEVAQRLSGYSGRRIGIGGPGVGALRFSGVLRWDRPEDWGAAFEATLPVRVEQAPDGIEITSRGG
ncbi:FecR domain-containing protein [Novosphingobium sp.]|uniref:FecR family protein n=1 Tax=Novosphingobium sp. TaxID=1874826 RepID=UPI0031CFFDD1